jgi:hypothetical protein
MIDAHEHAALIPCKLEPSRTPGSVDSFWNRRAKVKLTDREKRVGRGEPWGTGDQPWLGPGSFADLA